MEKQVMREWIASLEAAIDKKLKTWKKDKIENGEAIQLRWQFEQTHIILDVFWEDKKENVHFVLHSPRVNHRFDWDGLSDKTYNKILDRVGNLAMAVMHPVIDPGLMRE